MTLSIQLISRPLLFLSLMSVIWGFIPSSQAQTDPNHPNILLIIADDLGVDVSNGFQQNAVMPVTPVLDSLRSVGLSFKQVWAASKCSPTRAAIMSGQYGFFNGVLGTPGNLDTTQVSIFRELATQTNNTYADAVIGKWHLSAPVDFLHPAQHGIDHYEGSFGASVADYYDWTKVTNGVSATETEYATAHFTSSALNWVNAQNQPWLLWLAHVAPHSPFQVPPAGTYTSTPVNSNRQKYIAMIESMDYEIGRLFQRIPDSILENTVVIYIGDNGTPGNVIQNFASDHGKSTLYQGGVHVPMIVSGKGVTRQNQSEDALVHATDIFATILALTGTPLPGEIYQNSMSFAPLLTTAGAPSRAYNYTEIASSTVTGWAIRDAQYKLIEFADGTQEMYDLWNDSLEVNNLVNSLSPDQQTIKAELEAEVVRIQTQTTAIDTDLADSFALDIWPNPSQDRFSISFDARPGIPYQIEVLNMRGSVIQQVVPQIIGQEKQIKKVLDLSRRPAGFYFVKINSPKGSVVRRILKRGK